jgi:YihY family inner membrane protein
MQTSREKRKKRFPPPPLQKILESTQPLQRFRKKLSNDWVTTSAAGLAYHLITAMIPIAITLLAVLGLTIGRLDAATHARIIERFKNIFPTAIASQTILEPAFTALSQNAGILMMLALLVAIFSGSQLFIAIEGYFDIIYRTDMRKTIAKHVMATLMLCVFIVLTPLMVFASSIPALSLLFLENAVLNHLPGIAQLTRNSLVLSAASILGSLIATWMLFEAMYIVVPNQKIRWKQSWKGALLAAFLLEIFLILFPFYITHFMGSYTGIMGFILIFLFFFYYFAVILLVGAEVNAFYVEGVRALPDTLANFIHRKANEEEKGNAANLRDG